MDSRSDPQGNGSHRHCDWITRLQTVRGPCFGDVSFSKPVGYGRKGRVAKELLLQLAWLYSPVPWPFDMNVVTIRVDQ